MTGDYSRVIAAIAIACLTTAVPLGAQRGGAGRGRGPALSPREGAAIDLTGYWVSVISEDWKFRMVTPKKGVYDSLMLNAEGRRIADTWDPAKDEAAGEQCRAYGAANTDGDSFAYFRHSEVIAAGNLLSSVSYPVIDVAKGGSIQGVIDGLNRILDLAVAEYRGQGGTWIIPGRGRLSDTADVASYRNMLTIVRDRVKDSIKKGMTLAQVKASRPTMDFDPRFGSTAGAWTTDMFVEAAYKSLQEKK